MSVNQIVCRETGRALAQKLGGGVCVCPLGTCLMEEERQARASTARLRDDFERIAERCDRDQNPRKPIASFIARLRGRQLRKYIARLDAMLAKADA